MLFYRHKQLDVDTIISLDNIKMVEKYAAPHPYTSRHGVRFEYIDGSEVILFNEDDRFQKVIPIILTEVELILYSSQCKALPTIQTKKPRK